MEKEFIQDTMLNSKILHKNDLLSIYSRNIYLHPLNYYKRKIATNNIS